MQLTIEVRRTKASKKSISIRAGNVGIFPADGSLVHVVYGREPLAVTIDGDPAIHSGYATLKAIAKSGKQYDKVAGE
jgi:hypothetical protein